MSEATTFPEVTPAAWRALVEKELQGAPFDKALVHTTAEGLAIQPLYTEATATQPAPGVAPFARGAHAQPRPFRVCMRHDAAADEAILRADLDGGAEALWLRALPAALEQVLAQPLDRDGRRAFLVLDPAGTSASALETLAAAAKAKGLSAESLHFALEADPLAAFARGRAAAGDGASGDLEAAHASLLAALGALGPLARDVAGFPDGRLLVSTLPYHAAGADAADELALALSAGAATLGALLEAGLDAAAVARLVGVQVAVGRDTFGELCKLRALRLVWHKLFAAAGAPEEPLALLHAVASSRTLSQRDPWVNMLRVTTQVFAGVLGGADLVTPAAFDEALGAPGALGRRLARNTGLVLREESALGRVIDPAGGSYYLESLTDALAREAWSRFRALEREGGIVRALTSGALARRLEASWQKRREAIAKRKEPITGVSEFANLSEEKLPRTRGSAVQAPLASHRDAEDFEELRDRADALAAEDRAPIVTLVTLGPPAEHRARLGFASGFFAAGGLVTRELAPLPDPPTASRVEGNGMIACLCGSDERYAAEAAERARALKAAGYARVLLAGRPGPLEANLRSAGVDGFLYLGADVVALLSQLLGARA